jgi:hypothetical protein
MMTIEQLPDTAGRTLELWTTERAGRCRARLEGYCKLPWQLCGYLTSLLGLLFPGPRRALTTKGRYCGCLWGIY